MKAYLTKPKLCEYCHRREAAYDSPTVRGSWAYLCDDCIKAMFGEAPIMAIKLKRATGENRSKVAVAKSFRYSTDNINLQCICGAKVKAELDATVRVCPKCQVRLIW